MELKLSFNNSVMTQQDAAIALGDTLSQFFNPGQLILQTDLLKHISLDNDLSSTSRSFYIDVVKKIFSDRKKGEISFNDFAAALFHFLAEKSKCSEKQANRDKFVTLQAHRRAVSTVTLTSHRNFPGLNPERLTSKKIQDAPPKRLEPIPSFEELQKISEKLTLALIEDPSMKEFITGLARDNFIKSSVNYLKSKKTYEDKKSGHQELHDLLKASFAKHKINALTFNELIANLTEQVPLAPETPRRSSSRF